MIMTHNGIMVLLINPFQKVLIKPNCTKLKPIPPAGYNVNPINPIQTPQNLNKLDILWKKTTTLHTKSSVK